MADSRFPDDRVARLRLARSRGIGPHTYRQLIARFGTAQAALEALPDLLRRGSGRDAGRSLSLVSRSAAEDEIAAVERFGATQLFLGTGPYPSILARTEDAPPVLTVKGRIDLLSLPAVAMVGARNASATAIRLARQLAADLAESELVIVSGLARGIDTAAHAASLERGTIAVVAGGADVVYPRENDRLQAAIAETGLLIAEQPMSASPQARHFPRRNRIIAGLSLGTVVVEAAVRSGSLITARQATEYGREVMAVPGSPLDPRAQGTNHLIREGATLVQTASDVLEVIEPLLRQLPRGTTSHSVAQPVAALYDQSEQPKAGPIAPTRSSAQSHALTARLLSLTPVSVDELVRQSGLPPAEVHSALLSLELAGRLQRHAGGKVALAS